MKIIFISIIFSVASTFIFYFVEGMEMDFFYAVWNFCAIFLLTLSASLVLNRIFFVAIFLFAIFAGLIFFDSYKLFFMDDHLRWSDFATIINHITDFQKFAEFIGLVGKYLFNASGLIFLLALSFSMVFAVWIYLKERPAWNGGLFEKGPWLRCLAGICAFVLSLSLIPVTSNWAIERTGAPALFTEEHNNLGTLAFLAASYQEYPRPGHAGNPNTTLQDELVLPVHSASLDRSETGPNPDIVIWINESTFEPDDLRLAALSKGSWNSPKISVLNPDRFTIQSGKLDVGIFGGKSWNTVFALQSASHVRWFDSDTYAASKWAMHINDTLFKTLKRDGYSVDVVYAYSGFLFDVAKVQNRYGADRFWGKGKIASFGHEDDILSDRHMAEVIWRKLEKKSKTPRAILVFTTANHGPYPSSGFAVKPEMKAKWGNLPIAVYDYLSRLELTNQALKTLSERLMNRSKPTIFLHLGDHKPKLPGVTFSPENKYQSYYHFKSNMSHLDIGRHTSTDMDVIFLPARLLELANTNVGPLFQASTMLGKACTFQIRECSGRAVQLLEQYKSLAASNFAVNAFPAK